MAATEPLGSLFSPTTPSWRCEPRCRRAPLPASTLPALAGRWQIVLSLGDGFTNYGRRRDVEVSVSKDGSLQVSNGPSGLFDLRRFLPGRRDLCLVWHNEDGDECIVGRPTRGDALILSRSGKVSSENLFRHVSLLRAQGYGLRHLRAPR